MSYKFTNEQGYVDLAGLIISSACNDYLIAYKDYKYSKNKEYAKYKLDRAEKWFYTEHASFLLCGSNPDAIIRELDKLAENKVFNIKRRYRP